MNQASISFRYHHDNMKLLLGLVCFACAMAHPAQASAPVHKTIVGCVSNGIFTSDSGYVIKLRERSGGLMISSGMQNRRLQVTGNLLPGDNFYIDRPPIVVGRCG
ncbi:MAG: hypothetical protein WCG92_19175 [Hyphomicrobiales bacterium]|nr:hypothetical protein [Alphaproteobacteria bacterium]